MSAGSRLGHLDLYLPPRTLERPANWKPWEDPNLVISETYGEGRRVGTKGDLVEVNFFDGAPPIRVRAESLVSSADRHRYATIIAQRMERYFDAPHVASAAVLREYLDPGYDVAGFARRQPRPTDQNIGEMVSVGWRIHEAIRSWPNRGSAGTDPSRDYYWPIMIGSDVMISRCCIAISGTAVPRHSPR